MKTIKFIMFLTVLAVVFVVANHAMALSDESGSEVAQDTPFSNVQSEVVQDTQAGFTSDTSSQLDQDDTAANTSDENNQDSSAGVNANTSGQLSQDGTAGVNSNTSTQPAQNSAAGVSANTSSDEDQDGVTVPPVTPPSNGGTSGGTTNGGGGGGGTSGSTGSSGGVATFLPVVTSVNASCPLITSYLKFGSANDATQVTKLQSFLKNVEKANVDVNGIYDAKTRDAVSAFQTKYADSILAPWGASQPSGMVYITTMKTINKIACTTKFELSSGELAIINAYIARRDNQTPSTVNTQVGGTDQNVAPTTNTVEQETQEVGTSEQTGTENTAAVGGTSVMSRFWNFIKNLFR